MRRKNVSENNALVVDDDPLEVQVSAPGTQNTTGLSPVIQILLVGMLLLTYASNAVPIPQEINILYFSCAVIYIGSVKSLDEYSLK